MAKTFFANGQRYDIEDADIPRFKESAAANGFEVEEGQRYRTEDGHIYNLPQSKAEGFRESMPGATRVIPFKRDEDEKESYMTMGEVSQYLRSPEYRERHKNDAEQHSPAWAGVKGALSGAAEGLWKGANVAANKVAMALPEVAGAVTQGVGNILNGFGTANNPVGDFFVESGRSFASRVKDYASKIGLNLNEDIGEALGYDDALTQIADKASDVSKMSVKFAPAMASGGGTALANTIFASDAINAATDIHDVAKDNGFSEAEAMSAAGAAGLINYFGAKLLPKAGAIGNAFKNPAMKFVAGAAGVGNAMGVQGAANQAVQNLATRQPFTEGVGEAYAEGQTEGLFFHTINGLPGAVMEIPGYRRARAASKAEKAFVRDAMLDAAENKDGAALLNTLMDGEGLRAAEQAVREGKPISRSIGRKAGLPDNMSAEERTRVISAVLDARRNVEAERAKAEEIRGRDPLAAESEARRAEREAEAQAKVKAEEERVANEREITARRQQEIEEQKRQSEEYDRAERERIERERAEQEAAPTMNEERNRDYHDWLKRHGRKDTDKNFRKWQGENEIENVTPEDAEMIRGKGAVERERAEVEARDAAKRKAETVDALQRMVGERESAEADAIARDKWEKEHARRADLDRRAEERGRAEEASFEANEMAREAFEKHAARQEDIEAAFKDYDAELALAQAKRRQGKKAVAPKAPDAIREAAKGDAQLQELDRQYRSAQTSEERKAIEAKFAARVNELRKGMERDAAWKKENEQRAADRADAEAASWEADAKARAEWESAHKDAPAAPTATAKPAQAEPAKPTAKVQGEKPQSAETTLDKFLSSKSATAAKKAKKSLSSYGDFGSKYGTVTVSNYVEEAVKKGETITATCRNTKRGPKVEVSFKNGPALSGDAIDYAKSLGAKIDVNSVWRANEQANLIKAGVGLADASDGAVARHIVELEHLPAMKVHERESKLLNVYRNIRDARIKRNDWSLDKPVDKTLNDNTPKEPSKPTGVSDESYKKWLHENHKPDTIDNHAKFVHENGTVKDRVYEEYDYQNTPKQGAIKIAEEERQNIISQLERRAKEFRKQGNEVEALECESEVRDLNKFRVEDRLSDGMSREELHDQLCDMLDSLQGRARMFDLEGIRNYEYLGEYKMPDKMRSGIRSVDDYNSFVIDNVAVFQDRIYDRSEALYKEFGKKMPISNRIDNAIGDLFATCVDIKAAKAAVHRLLKPLKIDKSIYDKLSAEEGRAFSNQINKMRDAASDLIDEIRAADKYGLVDNDVSIAAYNEACAEVQSFVNLARKFYRLERDAKGQPILFTDNGKAIGGENVDDPIWAKSPDAEIGERVDLRRLDPKRRSDPKVLDWAKRKGRTISDGKVTPDAVREYDAQMAKGAAKAARRWFPDMNITYHDYGENIKRGQHDIVLRDTSGNVLGWFEPKSKNVHLLPGADAETVAHEIMWHGTRDWATHRAANGDVRAQKLLDMMHDVEKNAPDDLKRLVQRLYRKSGAERDVLFNEYGAWLTMGKGGRALEAAMAKAENRAWYAKAFNAVKEMFKDFLTKHGKNRVDLSKIDGMGRDEFVDFLASEFAGGKTLGKIGAKSGPTAELSTKETLTQKLRRKVYDINAAVRDLQRDIEKQTGKKLSDAEDVEAANALTPGLREAAVMNVRGKLAGYRDLLRKTGISDADAQYYMALKAAAGRDAKVDAKNLAKLDAKAEHDVRAEWGSEKIAADKDGFKSAVEQRKAEYRETYESTNGSHVSPVEAKRMLAELESGEHAKGYAEIRDYLRDVMDETLNAQVKAGLISEAVAAKYRAEEPDYIPFKNEFDEVSGEFGGRGGMMNLGRPEHYEAKGRQSAAGDITAHIFGDYQSSLLRGIETNVRQKLANLVKAHPEIGTIEKLSETNRLREKVKSDRKDKGNITGDPNLVLFKKDGDTYAIHLNGERGSAIAAAMTERNAVKWDGWYPKFARASAALATRWSPTFSVRNFTKDNIELSNIVFSEKGAVGGAKWIGNYLKSQKDMAGTLAKYITTGKIDATTAQGKMLKSYIDNGGLISGGATEGYDAIKRSFTPEAIAKEMKQGNSRAKAIAKHTLKSIAYLNEFAEMTTRVNAYVAELKSGATEQQAALFSRRATVDFNRKGENTGVTNIVRLFSNSTLGAQARAVSALVRGKYGRRVALALFANGFAQSMIEHYMNAEEDKKREKTGEATGKDMSEFERKTSLFYIRNGDNVYRVPQHESPFSLIGYAGNCVGRFVLGDMNGKALAKNLGVSALETAFPFTGLGSINLTSREGSIGEDAKAAIVSGFCPSALQPLAEMLIGVDYKGDPLYKRNYSATTPNSEVSKTHTPEYAKRTAAALNEATGGNEARKGYVDVHPEAVQKFVEGFGKNAARDVMNAWEVGRAILEGDLKSLTPREIPVKRDFVRPLDGNTARFYEAYNAYKADKDEFKKRTDWTKDEKREFANAHPWVREKVGVQVDKLVDKKSTQRPRSGVRDMGINQLRRLCDGWVLRKDGTYFQPKKAVTDEEKAAAKKELLRKQAIVVRTMGK